MLLSYSDDEDERVIIIDRDLNSFSTFVSTSELNIDTPSTSTTQMNLDTPTTSIPQPTNVSPPPTLLLHSNILREVCENIFEVLNKLVKARNDPIHTKNYEDKIVQKLQQELFE